MGLLNFLLENRRREEANSRRQEELRLQSQLFNKQQLQQKRQLQQSFADRLKLISTRTPTPQVQKGFIGPKTERVSNFSLEQLKGARSTTPIIDIPFLKGKTPEERKAFLRTPAGLEAFKSLVKGKVAQPKLLSPSDIALKTAQAKKAGRLSLSEQQAIAFNNLSVQEKDNILKGVKQLSPSEIALKSAQAKKAGSESAKIENLNAIIPEDIAKQAGIPAGTRLTFGQAKNLGIAVPGLAKQLSPSEIALKTAQAKKADRITIGEAKGEAFQELLTDIEKVNIVKEVNKNTKSTSIPTSVKTFEIISGIDPKLRGSSDYKNAFLDFRKETQGREQIVGATPEGQLIKFNTIDGKISAIDAPTLLPKTRKIVSGETATGIATMDSLINQISGIKDFAKSNPQFIGPIEGRWNKIKSIFVDNPDFTLLDRNIESLITLAYAQSGKQISEKEMSMLKAAILPSVTQPDANFEVALDFATDWLTRNRDARIDRLDKFNFFTGKNKNLGQQQGQTENFSTLSDEELANEIAREQAKQGQ